MFNKETILEKPVTTRKATLLFIIYLLYILQILIEEYAVLTSKNFHLKFLQSLKYISLFLHIFQRTPNTMID